jgi:hypothetical protein
LFSLHSFLLYTFGLLAYGHWFDPENHYVRYRPAKTGIKTRAVLALALVMLLVFRPATRAILLTALPLLERLLVILRHATT